jgi:hypothetical protein
MMIVLRFRARCKPERIEEALDAFREVVAPSRGWRASSASTSPVT